MFDIRDNLIHYTILHYTNISFIFVLLITSLQMDAQRLVIMEEQRRLMEENERRLMGEMAALRKELESEKQKRSAAEQVPNIYSTMP